MKELRVLSAKAQQFLITGEQALKGGDYDSCASRCYYAMFFMAEAALLTKNLTGSSHRGVIGLFGEHLAKAGIVEKHLGRSLNEAYDMRIVGDYGVGRNVTEDEAKKLMESAREFVQTVDEYLNKWQEKEQGT